MAQKQIPAKGTKGFILDCMDGKVYFRVYHNDIVDNGGFVTFTDYKIAHPDLEVTIIDEDAVFYGEGDEAYVDISLRELSYL